MGWLICHDSGMNGICEPLYAQGTQDTYFMLLRLTGSGNTVFFVWGSGSGHQEVLLPPRGWGSVNLMAMASPAPTDSFPFTAKDLYYSAATVAAQPRCGLKVQIWPGLVFESRSAAPDVRFGVRCAGLASSVATFPIPGFSSYCFYSCVIELYFPRTFLIVLDTYQTDQPTNSFSKLLFWFILCLFVMVCTVRCWGSSAPVPAAPVPPRSLPLVSAVVSLSYSHSSLQLQFRGFLPLS